MPAQSSTQRARAAAAAPAAKAGAAISLLSVRTIAQGVRLVFAFPRLGARDAMSWPDGAMWAIPIHAAVRHAQVLFQHVPRTINRYRQDNMMFEHPVASKVFKAIHAAVMYAQVPFPACLLFPIRPPLLTRCIHMVSCSKTLSHRNRSMQWHIRGCDMVYV